MNCRLQDEVQSMCEGAEAWCAGNRKFWAAAVGQKLPVTTSNNRFRLCKNADSALKSALLLKICRRLVSQQT